MAKKGEKRAANGMGSVRQRADGLWECRVTVGFNPATGKQQQRSVYGKTQGEAVKKGREISVSIDQGLYHDPDRVTVKSWFQTWVDTYCTGRLKPYTISGYTSIIENHINANIGALKMQNLRPVDVSKLVKKLSEKGLNPKTVKNVMAVARKGFEEAKRNGIINRNPCDDIELPKVKQHEIKPLADAEIPLFLSAIENDPLKNAFAVALYAGLREGELLGLPWDAVNFDDESITVRQQLQRDKTAGGTYHIRPYTKNDRPRKIKPPAATFKYLKAEKKRQAEAKLAAGTAWENADNLVFTDPIGRNIAIIVYYKHFKKIVDSIGRPDARPHDLRHSCASVALASGADIKSVQALMGHATAAFTMNVYGHVSDKMKDDTATRMEAYFESLASHKG